MKRIGYLDERDELVHKPIDRRTKDFCELAGMDYVFTMHARKHAELLAKIQVLRAHGTPRELSDLMDELTKMLEEV